MTKPKLPPGLPGRFNTSVPNDGFMFLEDVNALALYESGLSSITVDGAYTGDIFLFFEYEVVD